MRSTVVFAYHRVADTPDDPYRLAITPEAFEAQLRTIRRLFVPSRLADITRSAPRPRAVVTFDDGYADNLHQAAPIAAGMEIPIVVYVATAVLGDPRGFWWDRLDAICRRAGSRHSSWDQDLVVDLPIGPARLSVRIDGPAALPRLRDALHTRLRLQRRALIEATLDLLAHQLAVDPQGVPDRRTLTVEELARLSQMEGVEIGAHTADHELLSALSPNDQRAQISASRDTLAALTNRDIDHFAYPFGGSDAVDASAVRAVRRLGFRTAVTTLPGRVNRLTPLFRLPRYVVVPTDESAPAAITQPVVGTGWHGLRPAM